MGTGLDPRKRCMLVMLIELLVKHRLGQVLRFICVDLDL